MSFEKEYFKLVEEVLTHGYWSEGRNGATKSLIGKSISFSVYTAEFPLLHARKYAYRGVLGEFAALVRGPKCLADFLAWGCTYWSNWVDKTDHTIAVDYGNAWLDSNGVNQLEWVAKEIQTNPSSRRLIVNGWVPSNVIENKLSLPCCHYSYQFIVRGDTLNMVWVQRSADVMIGVPADAVLAATWLIMLANECKLMPGSITMQFADTHIYSEHIEQAKSLLAVHKEQSNSVHRASYKVHAEEGKPLTEFLPSDLEIVNYSPYGSAVQFLLKE